MTDQGPSSHPVDAGPLPLVSRELVATVCWLTDTPLAAGARYQLRRTTRGRAGRGGGGAVAASDRDAVTGRRLPSWS